MSEQNAEQADIASQPENSALKPSLTVFHDGECPVCNAEVTVMSRLDKLGQINWVDINSDDYKTAEKDFSYSEAMREIRVQNHDTGETLAGVDGFLAVWSRLPGYRRLVPFFRRYPLALRGLRAFYELFSRARIRIYRKRIASKMSEHQQGFRAE